MSFINKHKEHTRDVGAVLAEELEGVRVVVLHRLWHIDHVQAPVMDPVSEEYVPCHTSYRYCNIGIYNTQRCSKQFLI